MEILSDIPSMTAENVLVSGGPDDAGVYDLEDGRVMIQSVDFFTPIVDDPESYGQIAAANSLSDVYAMGAIPATALNIVGVPMEEVGMDRLKTILKGETQKAKEAGAAIIGGHTVKNPEPLVGLAVTGFVPKETMVRNSAPDPGDKLILTKPLGTGIITTAHTSDDVDESVLEGAIEWMSTLNDVGSDLAEQSLVRCMTDITGYGFFGHAFEMLGDDLGAQISIGTVPELDGARERADAGYVPGGTKDNWNAVKDRVEVTTGDELDRWLLADAQTSGGLLLAVAPDQSGSVRSVLRDKDLCSAEIGTVTSSGTIEVVE